LKNYENVPSTSIRQTGKIFFCCRQGTVLNKNQKRISDFPTSETLGDRIQIRIWNDIKKESQIQIGIKKYAYPNNGNYTIIFLSPVNYCYSNFSVTSKEKTLFLL
jgi:hypothetical protein